ncbi:DNA-processing protein DprA [Micromonospora sp. NPDC049175]|uniref:DNA-processing protein DprA n=1 Tax=Micromonospora sp. NPDC049175 TaxID=3364266 RepID=UPI0037244486
MDISSPAAAALLAATEVLPAEWRDLSSVLEKLGGPSALLESGPVPPSRDGELLTFLRQGIAPERLRFWRRCLDQLAKELPTIRLLSVADPAYPSNLGSAYGRPPFIFVAGTISTTDSNAVAIVGSRIASDLGRTAARAVAEAAAKEGFTVVSGLAEGIDSSAHEAALGHGRTIAVVGSGLDNYLRTTINPMVAKIADRGAIVSQFRPGSPATASSYVARNAIISGLSTVSLLIEATEKSGTRSEADHALQQDRTVLLWEPTLGGQDWARRYSLHPRVRMVSSADEVIAILASSVRN